MTDRVPLEPRAVRVGPTSLAYRVGGAGPPLVLVHGLGASSKWWARNVPALAAHFRVHLVDLPGHGRNARAPLALASASAGLAAWAEAVGLARASWVGQSMGGLIVARLAAERPDLVERLVLVAAAGLPFAVPFPRLLLRVAPALLQVPLRLIPAILRDYVSVGPRQLLRLGREVVATDLTHTVASIRAPTLVLWGERDPLIPVATAGRLTALIRGSRSVVVRGAGHNVMWERPDVFEAVVVPFLLGRTGTHPRAEDTGA